MPKKPGSKRSTSSISPAQRGTLAGHRPPTRSAGISATMSSPLSNVRQNELGSAPPGNRQAMPTIAIGSLLSSSFCSSCSIRVFARRRARSARCVAESASADLLIEHLLELGELLEQEILGVVFAELEGGELGFGTRRLSISRLF